MDFAALGVMRGENAGAVEADGKTRLMANSPDLAYITRSNATRPTMQRVPKLLPSNGW